MPKPKATTEHCRSARAMPRLSLMYGCIKLRPKRIPTVRAMGGENSPVKERTTARTKIIFASVGIDCERVSGREPAGPARTRTGSAKLVSAFRCGNSSGHYFSLLFSFAGGAEREDFAGADFEGVGCASAATIFAVAVLLT